MKHCFLVIEQRCLVMKHCYLVIKHCFLIIINCCVVTREKEKERTKILSKTTLNPWRPSLMVSKPCNCQLAVRRGAVEKDRL